MKFLVIALSLLVSNAYATNYEHHTSSFTIPTLTNDGTRVFYNCDSVEDKVKEMLVDMGAVVSYVRCTGGIDRFGNFHLPAHVKASYETLNSEIDGNVTASAMSVSIRDRSNCHLLTNSFNAVMDNFEIYSYNMNKCRSRNQRTKITIRVLKAQ